MNIAEVTREIAGTRAEALLLAAERDRLRDALLVTQDYLARAYRGDPITDFLFTWRASVDGALDKATASRIPVMQQDELRALLERAFNFMCIGQDLEEKSEVPEAAYSFYAPAAWLMMLAFAVDPAVAEQSPVDFADLSRRSFDASNTTDEEILAWPECADGDTPRWIKHAFLRGARAAIRRTQRMKVGVTISRGEE